MSAPKSFWAVTEIAHPGLRGVSEDCAECLALARDAISHARATGSKGSTFSEYAEGRAIRSHSATVVRAVRLYVRESDEDYNVTDREVRS